MNARSARSLALAAALLLPIPALAHEIFCEQNVGILETDEAGSPIVLAHAVIFTAETSPVLVIDHYPVTIGWALTVHNLAADASVIQEINAPVLFSSNTFELVGTVPTVGFAIPVGGLTTVVAAQRIGSFDECVALSITSGGVGQPGFGSSAPVCRDARESTVEVSTENDLTYCRAKIICMADQAASSTSTAPAP